MKVLAFVLVATIIAACSSSDSTGASGTTSTQGTLSSCDLTTDAGYCLDFDADAPAGEAKGNCASSKAIAGFNGTLNETAACPTANRVGSCTSTSANGVETTYRYYSPKFTSASAQTNCSGSSIKGTFTAN